MYPKNLDESGRWRSKTIAFRVTPEEDDEINKMVKLSGLTKQDYLTANMLKQNVVVVGNPRVFASLKNEMQEILNELKRIDNSSKVDNDLKNLIKYISDLLYEMNK